ncbi:hypothetical protein KPH14_002453 [Odynerus spinipes]|uniref:Retrotransposon gag domain-containing protein n=1 Tax=Odynerus spinipes TaxID=1348599 RepID=A0AAD9VLI1_9HYME|nr:hypothetical protein KPH14_002453 [Odynerus spinipes]
MPLLREEEEETKPERRVNQRNMEQLRRELEAAQAELGQLRIQNEMAISRDEAEQLRYELEQARREAADLRQQRESPSTENGREERASQIEPDYRREGDGQEFERTDHRIQFKDLEGIIPKFSGDDKTYPVENWIETVEEHAELYGWTPLQTLVFGKKSLEGSAKLWLDTQPTFRLWSDLKMHLASEFEMKINSREVHQMLMK